MRRHTIDAVGLAFTLALVLAIVTVVLGALAAAFSGYTVGQYVHDLALVILGLAAITYAVNSGPFAKAREPQGTTYQAPPPTPT